MNEKQHLQRLLSNGSVEVRAIDTSGDKPKIWSGIYDDYEIMRVNLIALERRGINVYTTINPLKIPASNKPVALYQRGSRDADVSRICSILFDLDPERPTGEASSEAQVSLAADQADKLAEFLSDAGWSEPTIGFSGNGAHLIYATEMSVNDIDFMRGLYAGLEARFSSDEIKFDVTVKNPSRICRVYGTTNQKAGRKTQCFYSDEVTDGDLVRALAEKITPPKEKPRHWIQGKQESVGKYIKNWDVVGAFQSNGLYLQPTKDSGKHFVTCINAGAHGETGPTDTVIWIGEWPSYHCSHAHCEHLDISDAIERLS